MSVLEKLASPFYVDDDYYSNVEDYVEDRLMELEDAGTPEQAIRQLPDDYQLEVVFAQLQKIIEVDHRDVDNAVESIMDINEDRIHGEWSDEFLERIKNAIASGIDVEKINREMPEAWYVKDGESGVITKADLLAYYKLDAQK
jgi:hypothetical protein